MKRTTWSIVILVGLAVVLLIAGAFTAVSSANAQLGNTGVPVTCNAVPNPDQSVDMTCLAADGSSFVNGTTVPTGHYLLVTDVLVNPWGTVTSGSWWISLYPMQGTTYLVGGMPFATLTRASFAEHFSTPPMWLPQGEHLLVYNHLSSPGMVEVYVTGLLTANVNYTPLIAR